MTSAPPPPPPDTNPTIRPVPPAGVVRPATKFLSSRAYRQVVALWMVLSVGGIALGFLVWQRLNTSVDAMVENAQFKLELNTIYGLLQEAEISVRNYQLTGNESYLTRYRRSEAAIPAALKRLGAMAKGNAPLRTDGQALHAAAMVNLAEIRRTIAMRHDRGPEAALAQVQNGEGEAGRESFRTLVLSMNRRQQDLFFVHREETRKEIQHALSATIAACLMALGAGLLAFHLSQLTLKQEQEGRTLAEQTMRASRAAREKSAFLANMGHEIRTPMNAILGFSDLLAAALPPEAKTFHYARSIRESGHSLLQLINDLLDLSKIESGIVELHLEPTDVRELVGFVRTVFGQQAVRKNLKLDIVVAKNVPGSLLLDNSRVRQVLVSLVSNAFKFTDHGSVTVRADWEPDPASLGHGTLVVELSDTGVGIPADRLEDIFRPFLQVAEPRAAESHGPGLGLSIVQRLTERMGGTVTIESVVGQGSTFRLRLPQVAISAHPVIESESEDDGTVDFNRLAPSSILVVDDNAINRELLAGLLDSTHHTVRFAANGREAVESVRHDVPNLVLMDIRMPLLDGESALAEIRKFASAESCPVIAVSASNMQKDEHQLRRLFARYLRKPFTRESLYHAMAALLHHQPEYHRPAAASTAREVVASTQPDSRETWPQLVAALRRIESTRWPAVCASGAILETRELARQLGDLGRNATCSRLIEYAATLAHDAESYAIASLEKHLDEFPLVIQFIEEQIVPSAK